jgi:hypothetical protein
MGAGTTGTVAAVVEPAAVVVCVVLTGLTVLQAGLAVGRPWGRMAWGGQHAVLPSRLRIGSTVSIVIYLFVAATVLSAAVLVELLPDGFADVAVWLFTGYFLLGVLMNGISRSRPERLVMVPVSLVLAACCLVVALG